MTDLIQPGDGPFAGVGRKSDGWAVGCHELSRSVCRLPAEDDQVQERVSTEAVRAVHGSAAGLAGRQKTRHDGVALAFENLALPVRGDSTHVVVDGWKNGRW